MKIAQTLRILIASTVMLSFTTGDNISTYLKELEKCKTTDQYFEMAQKFETLQPSGNNDWYPSYYAAYSYVLSAYSENDFSNLDKTLDLAQKHIDRAQNYSPDNDEIYCVASMIYSARILVNPEQRGYQFGQKSGALLEKAVTLNGNNPRALFLIAQSKMYMPVEYGGGCENAKPILDKALILFDSYNKPNANSPDWGKSETVDLINSCL